MPISLARLAELTYTGDSQLQTIHQFHNCVLGSITLCLGHLDCGVAEADCEAVLRAGPRGRGRGADVRRAREGGDRDGVAVQHWQVVTVPAVCIHTVHNITDDIYYLPITRVPRYLGGTVPENRGMKQEARMTS